MWTEESLRELINERLGDQPFIVTSYREPYIHTFEGRKIRCISPPSGLATALDPMMRASQGLWIACGTGEADGMAAHVPQRHCQQGAGDDFAGGEQPVKLPLAGLAGNLISQPDEFVGGVPHRRDYYHHPNC